MATATGAGWRETLAEVEQSIADCLSALDRYETAFGQVFGESAPRDLPEPPADTRFAGVDAKLEAARQQADEVEHLLAEQEAEWGRWRQALSGWQQTLAGGKPTAY